MIVDKCKCDLRTKLVGDGCQHCNPQITIDSLIEELQTLRAKVASAEVLVEALRTVMNEAEEIVLHDTNFVAVPFEIFDKMEDEYEALTTYDKLSEVKHDTK